LLRQYRLSIALLVCACNLYSEEPKRLALLLANSSYRHLPSIPTAPTELKLLSDSLERAKFEITAEQNFTLEKGQKTVLDFLAKVHPGDICFFYFNGYAVQAQQDNFLLPIDFDPAQQDIASAALLLIGIQQNLDKKEPGLKMLTLEVSRSDELLMKQGVGLAKPDLSSSTEILFAFSTRPDQFPKNNDAAFTKNLAALIDKKGLSLHEISSEVQKDAVTYVLQFFTQEFYFHAKDPVVTPPPPVVTPPGRAPGNVAHNNIDKEDYVWIPAGTFMMGCVPTDPKCSKKSEEMPQHKVTLTKGFWMGRNEVKTLSYERYVDADKKSRKMPPHGPSWDEKWKMKDSTYPMAELTADDAAAYCSWAGGELPTEAQWEYAARAGEKDKIVPFIVVDGKELDPREQANFDGTKGNDRWSQAAPVGSFTANGWNLLDMAGNVWEWCLDKYSKDYYKSSPEVDPQGPPIEGDHVVRGGSWNSDFKEHLRISYRESKKAGNNVGFRCVLPDSPATNKLLQVR
jgi:formylglycine-generating enzyme required for sulfatase activity